jgi:hypothetical protein
LNADPEDPQAFSQQLQLVCQLYQQAPELLLEGIHVISTDEMTGIAAWERAYPDHPLRPGKVRLQEFEYIRHGACCLIANWHVARGQVVCPSLLPTRTEFDFANHIACTLETDAEAGWIFLVDQLNIHKSASLVRLVVACCEMDIELGVKGHSGILQSMATRAEFLSEASHRIRFVYIPKHTSWLNQIECWFSILVRRLLKRGSFSSVEQLKQRIMEFIEYFNKTMGKPFKWTYNGQPRTA